MASSRLAAALCVLCLGCSGGDGPTAPSPVAAPNPDPTPTPAPTSVTRTLGGALGPGDDTCSSNFSAHDDRPCRRYAFTTTTRGEFDAFLTWTGPADLDMAIRRDSRTVFASLPVATSTDRMRTMLDPGAYEVSVVYVSGTALTDYTLRMTHAP